MRYQYGLGPTGNEAVLNNTNTTYNGHQMEINAQVCWISEYRKQRQRREKHETNTQVMRLMARTGGITSDKETTKKKNKVDESEINNRNRSYRQW